MHHVHMSTGFMFVISFLFIGLVAIIAAFITSLRRDRAEERVRELSDAITNVTPQTTPFQERHYTSAPASTRAPATFAATPSPMVAAAPVYHGSDPMLGLATGLLVGSALSHNHDTTVIHDSTPSHSYSSPSNDSGFSYSDSASSYDSGSGSGFDASW